MQLLLFFLLNLFVVANDVTLFLLQFLVVLFIRIAGVLLDAAVLLSLLALLILLLLSLLPLLLLLLLSLMSLLILILLALLLEFLFLFCSFCCRTKGKRLQWLIFFLQQMYHIATDGRIREVSCRVDI